MNAEAAFESITLENSILCKHNKIAGRVETVFCEAEPIRLNDISSLKRLGPGCCNECHQYNCTCLWEKHATVKFNVMDNNHLPCSSQTRWTPFENSMLYRLKKRNLYCGNMNSTHMQTVMRPVPKMHFTESEESSTTPNNETPQRKLSSIEPIATESNKPVKNFFKSKTKNKFPKIANKELFSSTKKYFNGRTRILEDTVGKICHHVAAAPTKQSKSSLSTRRRAYFNGTLLHKNKLKGTHLTTSRTATQAASQKLPKPSSGKPCSVHKIYDTARHYDYAEHINNIISSRSLLANQKVYTNNVPFPKDSCPKQTEISQPLCYKQGLIYKSVPQNSKVDEFFKENENEKEKENKVARTINSLENMQHKTTVEPKPGKELAIKASKQNIIWGSPSMIQQLQAEPQPVVSTKTVNENSKIYQKVLSIFNPADTECQFKIIKCDEKSFSSVAVQTDGIQSNSMLNKQCTTNESRIQPASVQIEMGKEKEKEKESITNEKKEPYTHTKSNSFVECNKQEKPNLEQPVRKDLNKTVASSNNNENPMNVTEVPKSLTKVKRIAALFEAEILAHRNKAKAFENPKVRNKLQVKTEENKSKLPKDTIESKFVLKTYSNSFQETNAIKSKDSGIGSDQAIPKAKEAQEKSSDSFSDCSVVTVVLKKKKSQ